VTARGQFHAELGGHDAAAAVGGVAGDADSHRRARRPPAAAKLQVYDRPAFHIAARPLW
jgi:hypothetical protein